MLTKAECDEILDQYNEQAKKALALSVFTVNTMYRNLGPFEQRSMENEYRAFMAEVRKSDELRTKWIGAMTVGAGEVKNA